MATIKDVAEKAGVAVSTASYALNGRTEKVSKETEAKILEAARELNYRPNAIARSLVRQKTDTIGLFLLLDHVDINQPYVVELIMGIMDVSRQNGYDIVLFSNVEVEETSYIERCKERSVDGAIVFGMYNDDPHLPELKESEIPIVSIQVPVRGKKTTYITSDHQKGAYKAVNYLLTKGHQNIVLVNGDLQMTVAQQRLAGYKDAYREAGLEFDEQWILHGDFEREAAYQKMKGFLAQGEEFTAVFAAANLIALGVMDALKEEGIDVPDQVSVICFDDISLPAHLAPQLTAVSEKTTQIGEQAIDMLVQMIDGAQELPPTFLEYQLIERGSVKEIN